jgi:hypothetical protein
VLCSLVTPRSGVLFNRVFQITAAFLFVGYVMMVLLTRYDVASTVRTMDESELERISKETSRPNLRTKQNKIGNVRRG